MLNLHTNYFASYLSNVISSWLFYWFNRQFKLDRAQKGQFLYSLHNFTQTQTCCRLVASLHRNTSVCLLKNKEVLAFACKITQRLMNRSTKSQRMLSSLGELVRLIPVFQFVLTFESLDQNITVRFVFLEIGFCLFLLAIFWNILDHQLPKIAFVFLI